MRGRIARRYLIRAGIATLWIAFIALAWFLTFYSRFGMLDFGAYYAGAERLVHGGMLYQGFVGNTYIYPPLLAQLLIPITTLSAKAAMTFWFVLNLALLIGVTAALDRFTRKRGFLWIITPIFLPVLEAVQVGQVTIILYGLLVGAWWAARTERRFLCGALLALAAWLKIYPALLIVYFAWKRDWRVVRAALIMGIVFALVQIVVSGIGTFTAMFPVLFSLTNFGEFNLLAKNASVNGFASQLFGDQPMVQALVSAPGLALITRGAISLVLIVSSAWVTLTPTADEGRFDLEYGLVILVALLLSPTLYASGLAPLLLVFTLLLRSRPSKRMVWCCTLACVALSIYWLFGVGYIGTPPISGLVLSFGFYVLMATWCVNAYLLRRKMIVQSELKTDFALRALK